VFLFFIFEQFKQWTKVIVLGCEVIVAVCC